MTDGSVLSHEWTEEQNCDAMFLISQEGRLCSVTLRNALILISRYILFNVHMRSLKIFLLFHPCTFWNGNTKNMFLLFRHYKEQKLDGVALVFLDHFLANEFDLCNWEYCYTNSIYPMAIPRNISAGLRSLHLGIMARYTSLMLFFMHNR